MTEKELIRRALLGDKQAQRKCTDEEIILPCPLCGGKASVQKDISGKERYHVVCSNVKNACDLVSGLPIWRGSAEEAIAEWNTRPAPPVGRCRDCMWSREPTEEDYKELDRDLLSYKDSLVCDFWEREVWGKDFCSYFEPMED